jgi:hypothetical protein
MRLSSLFWPLAPLLAGLLPSGSEPISPSALALAAAGNPQTGRLDYLAPVLALRKQRADYAAPDQRGMFLQYLATFEAMAGENDSAAYHWSQLGRPAPVPAGLRPALKTQPAETILLEHARQQRVLMFNEAHTQPKGRWLVGKLLPELHKCGFRYLALEALDATDTAGVRQRGFPVASSGFYVREPTLSNLVREARRLGMQVVAYDAFTPTREQDQARNLLKATLQQDPGARVVVLAGHAHINERPDPQFRSMAQWFKELSGVDPFTIDQTQLDYSPPPGLASPPSGAYVVTDTRYQPTLNLQTDLVLLNRLNSVEPGNTFGRHPGPPVVITIPADSLRPNQPQALLLYRLAEARAVVNPLPVAVRWLRPDEVTPRFALLPDTYLLELRDGAGRRRWQQVRQVK